MSAAAAMNGEARTASSGWSARFWVAAVLLAGDVLALQAAVLLGYLAREALSGWFPVSLAPVQFRGIALGILIVPVGCLAAGLYPGYGLVPVERLRRRTKAVFLSFAGLIAWGYLVHRDEWSRGILIAAMLFALLLAPVVERLLIRVLIQKRCWGSPVVVFGSERNGMEVANRLCQHRGLGLNPVAVLDLEYDSAWTGRALSAVAQLQLEACGLDRMRTAVVAFSDPDPLRMSQFVEALPFPFVILLPGASQPQTQSITAIDLDGDFGLAMTRNLLIPWNRGLKRAIDIVASALLLAAAAPVIAVSAVCIRWISPGGAFYRQERVGYRRRKIGVWKLRTMHRDAERLLETYLGENPEQRAEWESHCKLRDDPRILPGVGNFLRRTSLDELPQLWNVLKGDMSLVGPRPFPGYHLNRFSEDFRRMRECVYPGLTGMCQVSARDGDLQAQESLDRYYIRNWSLWLDIDIAVRTVRAVWGGRGAR